MKLIAELSVSPAYADEEVVEALCRQFPVCKKGAGFGLKAPIDDPLFRNVEAATVKLGLVKRSYSETPVQNQYFYGVHREYDEDDFRNATYLRLVHSSKLCDEQKRDSEGRLIVEAWRLTPELRMGCVLFEAAVVSDKWRQAIEKEGFIGVTFRPLSLIPAAQSFDVLNSKRKVIRKVTPQDQDHIEKREKFWELTSSLILPPIEPTRLLGRDEKPFVGDYSRGVWLKDEFAPPELHYRESALRKVEPFDFALTFEKIPEERWPVVSQRFRQFCIREKLKTDWFPVRIDP